MSDIHVRSEPLGGSPLGRAVADAALPLSWLETRPGNAAEWRRRLGGVASEARMAGWLDHLAPALAASGAAAERLARVARNGGAVVTTGQQPGLFGGPIYTWSKALSALALADELEAATGVATGVVFWAATDDADFAEAASTWLSTAQGAVHVALEAPAATDAGGRPMAEVPLGDVSAQLAQLAAACGSAADAEPLRVAMRAYDGDATVGSAYLQLLRALLEPLGIAVLDASHPAVRAAGDDVLRQALREGGAVERALVERSAAIEAAGFEPQVAIVDGLALVFERQGDEKVRVPLSRAAQAAADPRAELGPNVLLRPVVERCILPTAAYVAGPGELAYFAQVGAVADALRLPRPLAVPRWSCTLLEPSVRALLRRHELTVEQLADPHAAERRLARALLPSGVTEPLERLARVIGDTTTELAERNRSLVPAAAVEGFERALRHRTERMERRYRAAVARREQAAFGELRLLRGALYPGGTRQERALNILPLLARFGRDVLRDMAAAARPHAQRLVGTEEDAASRIAAAVSGLRAAADAVSGDGAAR